MHIHPPLQEGLSTTTEITLTYDELELFAEKNLASFHLYADSVTFLAREACSQKIAATEGDTAEGCGLTCTSEWRTEVIGCQREVCAEKFRRPAAMIVAEVTERRMGDPWSIMAPHSERDSRF